MFVKWFIDAKPFTSGTPAPWEEIETCKHELCTVEYRRVTMSAAPWYTRLASVFWNGFEPAPVVGIFHVDYSWREQSGATHTVTREELIGAMQAFEKLHDDLWRLYHDLGHLSMSLGFGGVWPRFARAHPASAQRIIALPRALARAAEEYAPPAGKCAFHPPLTAEDLGRIVELLSDCEWERDIPQRWARIDTDRDVLQTYPWSETCTSVGVLRPIPDYGFRVALAIRERGPPQYHGWTAKLVTEAKALIKEYHAFEAEDEARATKTDFEAAADSKGMVEAKVGTLVEV